MKIQNLSFLKYIIILLLLFITPKPCISQDNETLLEDLDGDGVLTYTGFGDSITAGVGDDEVGGYVLRLGNLLGIAAANAGLPGEELVSSGVYRFTRALAKTSDIIGIMEGSNDSIRQINTREIRVALQKMVNSAKVVGKKVILITLPTPCCDHGSLAPFTTSYSASIRDLALINEVRFADIERAWKTSCSDPFECEFYNLPEGLHPNGKGYDVMAQTIAASILGIDIFAPDGAVQLAGALGLDVANILVKPDLLTPQ